MSAPRPTPKLRPWSCALADALKTAPDFGEKWSAGRKIALRMTAVVGTQAIMMRSINRRGVTDLPTIVIVGAGPLLGLAIAKKFGAKGFNVGLIARSEASLARLAM